MPNIWLPEGVLPGFKEACLDFFWVLQIPSSLLVDHAAYYRRTALNLKNAS